jgi:hypothetical protein
MTDRTADDVPRLFAGVEEAAHLFAKPEPALRSATFAEQLPRLRKKYPIPLAPHVDSHDPHAALLLRSNFAGHRLAKVITGETNAEGKALVEPADQPRFFKADVIHAADINTLERVIVPALNRPDCFIIMAALKEGVDRAKFRRLILDDRKDAEFGSAGLVDAPRCFWPLDIEGFDAPESLDLRDVAACARYAREMLPDEFQAADCLATATAKHATAGYGVRLRMWFFFDRPITAELLKNWLVAAKAPFDAGALHASQPVYTARPLIKEGARDPLQGASRWARLIGDRRAVEAIDEETLRRRAPGYASSRGAAARAMRRRALNAARAGEGQAARLAASLRVRSAKEGERHKTLLRESFFLAQLIYAGAIAEEDALRTLTAAGAVIDKTEDEVRRCFDYALAKADGGVERWLEGGDR